MSLEFNCSLPRRSLERAGSIHHAPLPITSMHSPPFPPICRGEVSWDLLWDLLLVSPQGFCPTQHGAQEKEQGCTKAKSAHVCDLAEGCLLKMGADRSVYIPADG